MQINCTECGRLINLPAKVPVGSPFRFTCPYCKTKNTAMIPVPETASNSQGSSEHSGSGGSQGSAEHSGGGGSQGSAEYPGSGGSQGSAEYPGGGGSQGSTEYPGSGSSQGSAEYPGSGSSQGSAEYPGSDNSQGSTEYPESGGSQGSTEYPGSDNSQGSAEYPESDNSQGSAEYPESDNSQRSAEYPESDNSQGSAEYPESDNSQGSAEYPESDNSQGSAESSGVDDYHEVESSDGNLAEAASNNENVLRFKSKLAAVESELAPNSFVAESLDIPSAQLMMSGSVDEKWKALVLYDDEDVATLIADKLDGIGFNSIVAANMRDAAKQLKFLEFSLVVIQENYQGSSLRGNHLLQALRPLAGSSRRSLVLVVISPEMGTMDEMITFALSLDLIVNSADIKTIDRLVASTIGRNRKFYSIFKESLEELGLD